MDTKALKDIGLTDGETKVYLTLSKLGETKTGPLAKEAEVSSSKVYKILDRLQKKGLVGFVTKNKVRYFKATEPERIIDYVNEKQREMEENKKTIEGLIPQLRLAQNLSGMHTEVTIFEGFKGLKNLFYNMLDELRNGDEYYVIGADYGEDMAGVRAFFEKYHQDRAAKDVKVNMLASYKTKGNLVKSTALKSTIRYLPENLFTKLDIIVYNDKVFLFFIAKDSKSIFIHNNDIAESFKTYFKTFWKMAKK